MRRRTKAIIVGTFTGSALLGGTGFALAGSHGWHHSGQPKTASQPGCVKVHDDAAKAAPVKAKGEDDDGRENESGDDGEHRGGTGNCGPSGRPTPSKPGPAPSSAQPVPSKTTTAPAPPPSPSATATTPACASFTGAGANVAPDGVGTITVTINVCNGVVTSASATQSQSNWPNNPSAILTLNSLVPANYKTNVSKIFTSAASLTSAAYQTSLKSALTKAGL